MIRNTLFALLLLTIQAKAQTFMIRGTLKQAGGQPAPSLNVMLYRMPDSTLVKISISDGAGNFRLPELPGGNYCIRITGRQFQDYSVGLFYLKGDTLLNATISNKIQELGAISVTGRRPLIEVLADKTVFNIQNSLASTGLSGFEVLRKAPGVIIDNQDNLIVEGKAGVSIYIDGRISPLSGSDLTNYLKTLQSTDIDAIEIITQPSSKYDAAGNAGIINIRLVKNKSYGTNGSATAGYAIGRYSKYNGSASLNSRTRNLNFYSTYSGAASKNYNYINLDRFQSGYEYDQQSFTTSKDHSHNIRAGIDYSLNKTNTLGILLNGNFSNYNGTSTSRTPIVNENTAQTEQVLRAGGTTRNHNDNISVNVNFRHIEKGGSELTIDGDYGHYKASRNNLQPNYYYSADETMITSQVTYRMNTPVNIRLLSLKGDYSQSMGKIKISAGGKLSSVRTDNTLDFYDIDTSGETYNASRSNTFNYQETIVAGYLNLGRSWKSISIQAGVRAEYTHSDGELSSVQQNAEGSVKRHYLDLFPSGGATWAVNEQNSLALNYSRRIERPNYRSLNPFIYNIDELSFSKGNPFLKPQYTDAIKLSHTYRYSLTTSFSYSYIRDFFAQITDTSGSNSNYISPQNIADEKVFNIGISYPFSIYKWWNVYANVDLYRSSYSATNSKFVAIVQHTLSLYGQNTFTLPANYQVELSGWFSSPSIWAGTYRTKSLGSLDLAVQKKLAGNQWSIRMAVSDIFRTSNWTGTTRYGDLFIKGSGGYESRQFRVSLQYNFGRKEVKPAERRQSGAEEEKERVK